MTDSRPTSAASGPAPWRRALPYLLITIAVWSWAGNLIIARAVRADIPPIGLSFWRWFIAAVVLLPFAWPGLRAEAPLLRAAWKQLCLLGFLLTGGSTLAFVAVNHTTAINASLVYATQPAAAAFIGWILFRHHFSRLQVLGVVAALLGILAMMSRADWGVLADLQLNGGDLWMIAATTGLSAYSVLLVRLRRGLGLLSSLFVMVAAGSLLLLPFYIAESTLSRTVPLDWLTVAAVFYAAVITSVIAVMLWNTGIAAVGANRGVVFSNLTPVFASAMAIVFLGERVFAYHLIGAALICLGIVFVVRGHRQETAPGK